MKKFGETILSYAVAGIFVIGAYAILHFMLKLPVEIILWFCLWLIWSDLAKYMNKPDAEAPERAAR